MTIPRTRDERSLSIGLRFDELHGVGSRADQPEIDYITNTTITLVHTWNCGIFDTL